MDKSLKIVLSVLALYAVLSIQFFADKGVFIIPYEFNPIVIWIASGVIVLTSTEQSNFSNNLLYFIGISIYCLLSERTLSIIYNQTNDVRFFMEVIHNPFTRLISILGLLFSVLTISYKYVKYKYGSYLLGIAFLSGVFGLINYPYLYILFFTVYTICFVLAVNLNKNVNVSRQFSSVANQLFLFSILEGIFSFII